MHSHLRFIAVYNENIWNPKQLIIIDNGRIHILLNNIGLGLALERPPAGLAVFHVLQL